MPPKSFDSYFKDDNWFVYDKIQRNGKSKGCNYYWHVRYPSILCLNDKAFNKAIYTIDDAKKWRNEIIYNYLQNNDKYKNILEFWLEKSI